MADRLAAYDGDVVAAIDAPLVVTHLRGAERSLGRVFGRFHAGAYMATPAFLAAMGGLAGPLLGAALVSRGFKLDPAALVPGSGARVAIEVYPHAAHIVLFELEHILKYKKGRVAGRREGLASYQAHLRRVLALEMPALATHLALEALLDPACLTAARGRGLKAIEDRLDAVTCMVVAFVAWRGGAGGMAVFGCAEHGYIVTPGLPPGAALPIVACVTCARALTSP